MEEVMSDYIKYEVRVYKNGKYWFINGIEYTEADFKKEIAKSPCEGKIVEIDGKKYTLTSVN